jgi:hypothetical protein
MSGYIIYLYTCLLASHVGISTTYDINGLYSSQLIRNFKLGGLALEYVGLLTYFLFRNISKAY